MAGLDCAGESAMPRLLNSNPTFRRLLLGACCALLAACGGGSGGDDRAPAASAGVRVFNAIPDSPALRAEIDGELLANVSFGQASPLSAISRGAHQFEVFYTLPDGSQEEVMETLRISAASGRDVSLILSGPMEAPSAIVLDARQTTLTSPRAELHLAHAATGHERLDFHVTAADAELTASTPLVTLDFGEGSDVSMLDGGEFRLRVTPEGDDEVLFDSGPFELAPLTRRLLVAVDYFGPGEQDMRVVRVSPNAAATFVDEQLPAAVRLVNLVYDLPAVDAYLADEPAQAAPAAALAAAPAAAPDYPAVPFGADSGFREYPAGAREVAVTMEADASAVLLSASAQLVPGEYRTLVVTGSQVFQNVRGRLVADGQRRVATQAALRVVHGAPSAGEVDFYLLAPEQPVADGTPDFRDLTLLTNGLVEVEPGQYDLTFTRADEETVLVGPERVRLEEGGVYTVFLFDASGGGTPTQLLLADDFAVPQP